MSTSHLARLRPWNGAGCFAVDYLPGAVDDPRRELVKRLKAGDAAAMASAAQLLAHALDERRRRWAISLVAVPGHAAVINSTTEALCARLAAMLPCVRHRPAAVRRCRAIRRSATAAQRPTVQEHLDTVWVPIPVGGSVIIVDDVFTHGRITDACIRLLRDAGASEVIVAAVARTRT
jgi:predicted amidophosphoribosyltransferase